MRLILSALILLHSLAALAAPAPLLTPSQQLEDLHQLVTFIRDDYGPLRQKQERLGLDLDALVKEYEGKIQQEMPADAFAYLLRQFVGRFHDSHFIAPVPSSEGAKLGFTADIVEGKILLDTIDRKLLPESRFPFQRGDEIISFGGRPVGQEIQEYSSYFSMANAESKRRVAVFFLALREGKRGPVPGGSVELELRHGRSTEVEMVSLPWVKTAPPTASAELGKRAGLGDWCAETSRIALPPGAEAVAGVPFTAFTFPTANGRVGFLRIPHYFPVDALGKEAGQLRFSQYESVVKKFEAETIGLVIDQDFNCGGSILFANKMMSLFARAPFTPASFSFRASKGQIEGLARHLAKFSPATEGYSEFRDVVEEIKKSYAAGEFATRPLPVRGVMEMDVPMAGGNTVLPNAVTYTKPVVLLINEMSASGGDLFPSLMQDLGRAVLFGNHTMGAGGHLWDDPHLELKHSRMGVNLTRSLFYRLNGALIENEGVSPEMRYEVTKQDFLHGFQDYLQAATQEVLRQL